LNEGFSNKDMGQIDDIYDIDRMSAAAFPASVVFFAEPHLLAAMPDAMKDIASDVEFVGLAIGQAIPHPKAARASVAVLQIEPTDSGSLERLDRLKREFPDLPVIVGLANVDMRTARTLLRQGITEIVGLPFNAEELHPILLDVAAKAHAASAGSNLASIISVVKATGGCGGTTIATHLAYALKQVGGDNPKACLIDLDIQQGTAASYLGAVPRLTLSELLDAGERLDDDLFHAVRIEGAGGVDLIAAPADIIPIEAIEFDHLMRAIRVAQIHYDVVLLDLPTNLTNWALSIILASDLVLLVGELELTSLRQVKRRLDLLASMGFERRAIAVVINKVEQKLFGSIKVDDAERAINHPVTATITRDHALIAEAQDQGLLAFDIQKRSKFGKEISALAETLQGRLAQ
jgi:pilus assembly protein CpaE